jgi:Baseplate J-like protein
MSTTIQTLTIKSQDDIRDDYLRTWRNMAIQRGIANPNVSEGTEIYLRAQALAQQIYQASVMVPVALNAQMADTAQGDDLVRVATIYMGSDGNLRPAGPSAGPGVLAATVSTAIAIPTGAQLIDASGLAYQVSLGGQYMTGQSIPIESVDTGTQTNLEQGDVLRWVAPPPFVSTTLAIGLGGLTGGVDAETYEGLRARLYDRLQNPPNGVNAAAVNLAAQQASTAVQKSFAYPACNGPSSIHYAVTRAPTATNVGRDVAALVVAQTVIPGVLAAMPEFVEVVGTTVYNYPIDVAFGLSLPAAPTADPAGPGGGWLDGQPFPTNAASLSPIVPVSSVTSSTVFEFAQVDQLPSVGQSVCWLSTDDWVLRTAKILAYSGGSGSGPYTNVTVTVDTPFVSTLNSIPIAVDDMVWPAAVNGGAYVAAALAGFAQLGPYEKTNSAALLPRALRRPTLGWPSTFGRSFLRSLTNAGPEVDDAEIVALAMVPTSAGSWPYAVDAASPAPTTVTSTSLVPPLPAVITGAPYVIVPNRLGFYPI